MKKLLLPCSTSLPFISLFALLLLPSLATDPNPICPSDCGHIPVSFPFGANLGCGAPGFQLSHCDDDLTQWNGAVPWSNYSVQSIHDYQNGTIAISLMSPNCTTFPASDASALALYRNLTKFTQANVTLSPEDSYLLFNCSPPELQPHPDASWSIAAESEYCGKFKEHCSQDRCSQITGPVKEVNLSSILQTYNCTGFTPFINGDYDAPSWEVGIQVYWNEVPNYSECYDCQSTDGICGYDTSDPSIFLCYCGHNKSSKSDCKDTGCIGSLCSPISKVLGLGVPCAIIAVAAIALVAVYLFRRKKKSSTARRSVHSYSSYSSNNKELVQGFADEVGTKLFTFEELLQATESFSENRRIGDGGFGAVYEGRLHDGRRVAVKRLYHDNYKRMDQFFNEISILSSLHHSNLVKLYGFCCQDERDLILVFEYVSNGTIADHLHGSNVKGLPWEFRLNIALETAEALSYLHNSVNPPIFHRDVKSTNILLDQNFHVKLADFGLSRLVPLEASHISTAPQGTPGYLDPDYHQCYRLTGKSDVYSFGVVLMELVSAKLAVDMSRDPRDINLSNLAIAKIQFGALDELVDPSLEICRYPDVKEMVKGVADLGFRCLAGDKDDRPTMKDVAEELAKIKQSGYGGRNRQSNIDILNSSDSDETREVVKPAAAVSPTSVQSRWPSSTTSSEFSIS